MNIEEVRQYALSFPDAEETFPFGPETLVWKVSGKIFGMVSLDEVPPRMNLKCDPDEAEELRASYPDTILPGYHMNKKHWNTVVLDGSLPRRLVKEMITASYQLVAPKKKKA